MTKNYFSIERSGKCFDKMCMANENGDLLFEDVMDMSCDEIKTYEKIDSFLYCAMELSNKLFEGDDDQTIITLIDEDGVFIWSIILGPDGDDMVRYVFVDWKKDGKQYRYEKD